MQKMNLSREIKETKEKTLYQRAVEKYKTSYIYVVQIATGERKGLRGKGKEIKEFLLTELNKLKDAS